MQIAATESELEILKHKTAHAEVLSRRCHLKNYLLDKHFHLTN